MTEAILNFLDGEWECPKCHRKFPTHYKLRDSGKRKQFGRRYVSAVPNVIRHINSCRG